MLGIDTSKKTLAVSLLDPQERSLLWYAEVPNSPAGFKKLHEKTPPGCAWVLEPTGRCGEALVRFAQEVGRPVLMAEPRRAKAFLRSVHPRAKADRLDSFGIGLFALSQKLPPYPQKSDAVDHLDQLLSARRGLSQALTRLSEQMKALPRARESLRPAVEDLEHRLKELDEQIAAASRAAELAKEVARLKAVPGFGPVTATAMASRLLSKPFEDSDALVGYVGLDVRVWQSGPRRGSGKLSKHGDAELRRLLFNRARAAVLAKNAPFREQFERERQKGLSTTAAYCAVARKLARLAWSLVQHQGTYDPERVYTRPVKTPQPEGEPRSD